MKKHNLKTTILSNRQVAEDHYLLYCDCPEIATSALPGQFIHVLFDQGSGLLLRRPFTIYSVEGTQISMLYQVIGEGTSILSKMCSGDSLQVLGPLGNPFTIDEGLDLALVVGGGAGIASLMLLVSALQKRKIRTDVLVGAMNQARLLSIADLLEIGIQSQIATDNGSTGHHGFVTELLLTTLAQQNVQLPTVFTCGPYGMLKAVVEICQQFNVRCQVAMENRMGCALGVCLGCVCKVRMEGEDQDQSGDPMFEYQRVCIEGPVFLSQQIIWD